MLFLRPPYSLMHTFVVGNFCFPCFASQAPGLCSAIPSASVKFVARLCFALLFCVVCLTNIAFVEGFSLRLSSCLHAMFCFVFSFSVCYVYFTSRSLVCECYSLGSSIFARLCFSRSGKRKSIVVDRRMKMRSSDCFNSAKWLTVA